MKRLMIALLMSLAVLPVHGQNVADPAYQAALRRIEEARVSGATELNLSHLVLKEVPPEI